MQRNYGRRSSEANTLRNFTARSLNESASLQCSKVFTVNIVQLNGPARLRFRIARGSLWMVLLAQFLKDYETLQTTFVPIWFWLQAASPALICKRAVPICEKKFESCPALLAPILFCVSRFSKCWHSVIPMSNASFARKAALFCITGLLDADVKFSSLTIYAKNAATSLSERWRIVG